MGAAREPDQADFDLERFIDMFDTAITSQDPRVMETLRSLLMIVTLTRPETSETMFDRNRGPLRRMFEDMRDLNGRLHRMEAEIQHLNNKFARAEQPYRWEAEDKYTLAASAKMAQQIDQDVLNQLKQQHYQASKVISGGLTLGPEKAVKGLK